MKGHPEVVQLLNDVLGAELIAINQYFMHGKMCDSWGYLKLGAKSREESIDEMRHADLLIDRILSLKGLPNLQKLGSLSIGETVPEQMSADLALEKIAIERLNAGLVLCRKHGDGASETLLRDILVGEEEHADWLETQLELIERLGSQTYLSQQLYVSQQPNVV